MVQPVHSRLAGPLVIARFPGRASVSSDHPSDTKSHLSDYFWEALLVTPRNRLLSLGGLFFLFWGPFGFSPTAWSDAPAAGADSLAPAAGAAAIKPAAPVIPGEIVAALQEAKFDAARAALASLREKAADVEQRAYLGYLQGIAERLAGRKDLARATLSQAARDAPNGAWAPKIQLELAAVELASGNLAAAEELARSEAMRLLADDRKDRLAEVYHVLRQAASRARRPGGQARSQRRVGPA